MITFFAIIPPKLFIVEKPTINLEYIKWATQYNLQVQVCNFWSTVWARKRVVLRPFLCSVPGRSELVCSNHSPPVCLWVSKYFTRAILSPLSGSKCVKPPKPDDSRKMVVSWNPDFPPAHNEQITYKCNAGPPYNRCGYSNLLKLAQCISVGNYFQSKKVSDPYKMKPVKL